MLYIQWQTDHHPGPWTKLSKPNPLLLFDLYRSCPDTIIIMCLPWKIGSTGPPTFSVYFFFSILSTQSISLLSSCSFFLFIFHPVCAIVILLLIFLYIIHPVCIVVILLLFFLYRPPSPYHCYPLAFFFWYIVHPVYIIVILLLFFLYIVHLVYIVILLLFSSLYPVVWFSLLCYSSLYGQNISSVHFSVFHYVSSQFQLI